ncbi:metal-dependent hydrolase [Altererythrobacter sp. KTW20L]|uniref:metal-dependent hydrolase n=1 Tax=Altererythrobacter sp. KTW20L TaxID=2942210 RepID=UPI0020C0F475|nr:metal-dependent hydrolase [Altererythrobacter sp. KTW20L]MCL6250646.1 metal-dependent hydrolase [Altererythrobacter sp. KTW20L]
MTTNLDLGPGLPHGKTPASKSPPGLTLTVRDRRFAREHALQRGWAGGDPVASAWLTALSASFPRGEAMFIDAVKAHRDGVPPQLEGEIRDFIRQEVNHSREHLAFNRAASEAGYDLSAIDERVAALVAMTYTRPPIVRLAITTSLEHFTAIFAHQFLAFPEHFKGSDSELADLWRWHAVEEIEHKAVAYDTFLHATRDWPEFRRWLLRTMVMLDVTVRFITNRCRDALELLAQDGITGWRARWRLTAYLLHKPGILRRLAPGWLSWFAPGFHPWNHDDRHLLDRAAEPA